MSVINSVSSVTTSFSERKDGANLFVTNPDPRQTPLQSIMGHRLLFLHRPRRGFRTNPTFYFSYIYLITCEVEYSDLFHQHIFPRKRAVKTLQDTYPPKL